MENSYEIMELENKNEPPGSMAPSEPLHPVARLLVGAVMEDAVDQLAIVSATFGPVPSPHINTSRRKLEDILLKEAEEEVSPSGGDIKQLHCETGYIQKVLEQTIASLYKTGEGALEESLDAYRARLQEKEAILVSEQQVRQEISSLTLELEELRATEVELRKKEMRKIAELKDSYLDCRRRGGSEETYVARQEEVRERERQVDLRDTEAMLAGRTNKLETDIEHEERVTAEVESFLRDQHLELSSRMEEWSRRYEEDTRAKREELVRVKQAKADGLQLLREQTTECQEVEGFVAKVKAEKERARQALELEARREKGAVKIQAWWRGIMVRHCLGQFRKNKTLKAKLMKILKNRK